MIECPPKKPLVPVEPITSQVNIWAVRPPQVAAAMEGLATDQLIDRLILESLDAVAHGCA